MCREGCGGLLVMVLVTVLVTVLETMPVMVLVRNCEGDLSCLRWVLRYDRMCVSAGNWVGATSLYT